MQEMSFKAVEMRNDLLHSVRIGPFKIAAKGDIPLTNIVDGQGRPKTENRVKKGIESLERRTGNIAVFIALGTLFYRYRISSLLKEVSSSA